MGYLLRMSAEIRDWLIDLRASDPAAARRAGEALAALLEEGAALGPPLAVPLAELEQPPDYLAALDDCHDRLLHRAQSARWRAAEAAGLATDVQEQITALNAPLAASSAGAGSEAARANTDTGADDAGDEAHSDRPLGNAARIGRSGEAERIAEPGPEPAAPRQLAELRALLPGVLAAERKLAAHAHRLQLLAERFRARKEVLKARYTAALAEQMIAVSAAAFDGEPAPMAPGAGHEPDPRRLAQVIDDIERELAAPDAAGVAGGPPMPPGLIELRPGAPDGSDLRLLLGVEPAGTAVLLAVVEGREAVRDDLREAVRLSGALLRRLRAGHEPDAAEIAYDDARSFLDEFFPGEAAEVAAGAAALADRNRGHTLAEQRMLRGLTTAEVAERMRVRPERVAAIERAEAGAADIRTLAAYVGALGGRLEIIADFGSGRAVLR